MLLSGLQNLRKPDIDLVELERVIKCVRCYVRVADYQRSKGRYLDFTHPLSASSWNFGELRELTWRSDVEEMIVAPQIWRGVVRTDAGEAWLRPPREHAMRAREYCFRRVDGGPC